MHQKEAFAVWIVIFVAIGVLGYFVTVTALRLQALEASVTAGEAVPVDVSGWHTYRDSEFGFEIEYPAAWQVSTDSLAFDSPYMLIGNPLDGTSTYQLAIFIEKNPDGLSSGEYVHALLDAARAEDEANAKIGPTPQIAPTFDRIYLLTAGGNPAYELYDVFEFDHRAERIYVAHATETLRFDFPVAQENPNISLPVANNGIAHNILNTLVFTK